MIKTLRLIKYFTRIPQLGFAFKSKPIVDPLNKK